MNSICNQKGASIIAVIAVMLILAVMGATLISLVTTGSDVSVNQLQSEQALNVAEGGKEYALRQLKENCSYAGEANIALGSGTFTVTVTGAGTKTITSTATVGSATRVVVATAQVSCGSIAVDSSSRDRGRGVISLTWQHNVSGVNRILIVGVSIRNSGSQTVTGVTYSGTALTFIGAQDNGTNVRVELWRSLVEPATGNNPIVVTLSASANVVGGAVSLTEVDQTTPIDAAFVSATGNSNAPSVGITTVTNNAWVIDTMASPDATATVGAGQTEQWNFNTVGGPPGTLHVRGAGSTEGPNPAGGVTMNWTLSAAQQWAIGAVALKPAPAGVTPLTWQEQY